MLLLLRISILAITYLYFFRETFIEELAISFLPYIICFCILAVIIEIYLIIHESKRRTKHKSLKIFITILVTILTFIVSYGMSKLEFIKVYNRSDKPKLVNKSYYLSNIFKVLKNTTL